MSSKIAVVTGAGSGVGRPSIGSRACRWMMLAPASAAAMDCSAISCGVIGRWSDMEGVWIAPVTAQVMMTLDMTASSAKVRRSCPLRRRAGDRLRELRGGAVPPDAVVSEDHVRPGLGRPRD